MSEARDFNQGGEGMTVMMAENVLSHLSHPLGRGQRDKSGFYGTANGTRAGQASLKALALNVLRRDSTWDESGTIVCKLVGQNNEKKTVLSAWEIKRILPLH